METSGAGRKPLLEGHGVLLVPDFCRHTGIDPATVDELIRSERLEGALLDSHGRPFGILDDALPTRDQLMALGLDVRDDYDPESLRSVMVDETDD